MKKINFVNLPICGFVSCGKSEDTAQEPAGEVFPFPDSELETDSENYYLLQANGDSMVDINIQDGDLILVEKCSSAKAGDVVVVLDENSCTTLKRLEKDCKGVYYLHPENKSYPNMYKKSIIIQGIARSIIKRGCR